MPGFGLLLKAVRRGLLGPAERAGLFPARYYVALALEALEDDDLDGAVAALEAVTRRHEADPRATLAREQTIFRLRTIAARHRGAAARAEARAGYLESLAAEGRRRLARAAVVRRRLLATAVAVAVAGAAGGAVALAGSAPAAVPVAGLLLAIAAAACLVWLAGARPLPVALTEAGEAEASRLTAAAEVERGAALRERAHADRLEALESRLAVGLAAETADRPGEPRPVVLEREAYRRLG
jgi:hypothetical protein